MKSFKYWKCEEVEDTFDLTRIYENFAPLQNWLATDFALSAEQQTLAQTLCKNLLYRVDDWNEEELKVWFIAPAMQLVDFHFNNFNLS